jgi:hypothetical protein
VFLDEIAWMLFAWGNSFDGTCGGGHQLDVGLIKSLLSSHISRLKVVKPAANNPHELQLIESGAVMSGEIKIGRDTVVSYMDCGKWIIDSLIGTNVKVLDSRDGVPKGIKLLLGDMT